MTKERPIIFSGEMIRAILGRKTQTRRVVKPLPDWLSPQECCAIDDNTGWQVSGHSGIWSDSGDQSHPLHKCPYGKPGDQLWVRENFCRLGDYVTEVDQTGDRSTVWWSDHPRDKKFLHYPSDFEKPSKRWRTFPSIHMPRWASRIQLEITNIRVERLQDISEQDAIAEGAKEAAQVIDQGNGQYLHCSDKTHKSGFQHLWDSINNKKGFGWNVNPWVWVIEFRKEFD